MAASSCWLCAVLLSAALFRLGLALGDGVTTLKPVQAFASQIGWQVWPGSGMFEEGNFCCMRCSPWYRLCTNRLCQPLYNIMRPAAGYQCVHNCSMGM